MDNPAPADPDEMYRRPAAPTPPALPPISDYWPDAPHRIGPPADHYSDEPTAAAVDSLLRSAGRDRESAVVLARPAPRRSRRKAALVVVLAAVLVAGAGVTGFLLVGPGEPEPVAIAPPRPDPSVPAAPETIELRTTPPPATPTVPPRANGISAPAGERAKASFELVSDTVRITLRATDLGGDLYRITTAKGGSVLPRAQTSGAGVKLFLDDSGERGDAAVTVLLNSGVRWSVRITGGVRAGVFDLSRAEVDEVDFAGGAARIDLTLPRPEGTLPIRLSGGVNRFEVATDQGVPVRVRTRRGAGQVKLDGRTDDGVARGASFRSPDWDRSRDRIDLDAVAGVGTLRVGRS